MDEIKVVIKAAEDFLDRAAAVVDREGRIIAGTEPDMEGGTDTAALAFFVSDQLAGVSENRTYKRLSLAGGDDYVCSMEGTDSVSATYLDLLTAWLSATLQDGKNEADREALLKNILLENELPGDIPLKAREFRIPYAALRVAFLIRIVDGDSLDCMQILRNLFPNRKADFLLPMDEESIVLLKEINIEEQDRIEELALQILETINTESMSKVKIGIGMPVEILKDCAKSYREASLSLTVGGIFEGESYLMRYDKLGLGRLIYQLPPTLCQMFLTEVFPEDSYDELDSETLRTIQKFFENNLNGSETSRQLFVHRNTLVYRLDKVQKITGLDLRNFDDAVLFKLASMVRKYLEKQSLPSPVNRAGGKWWKNK